MKQTIIIVCICILGLNDSYGCSCDTISFEKATEWADEIFIGRLIQIREVKKYQDSDGNDHTRIWGALFEVEKKWKGSNDKYVEVFQPSTSCDFNFDFSNQPYIVYAKEAELVEWDSTYSFVGLGTWLCARNADFSTYNAYTEYSFDDREKLNKKFSKSIKLFSFNIEWKQFTIIILSFVVGLFIGNKIKKRNANKV